jgi:AcrR family transcriptional regulator
MLKTPPTTRTKRTQEASRLRREQERRELRERILAAAGEEFLEKGYDSFSLRRVAERIGYTPTTIYLYFRNKDDLLRETVQDGFAAFDLRVEETAAAHPDPLQRIEALGRAYIEFGLQNPALYRLMFMQRSDFYFMPRFVDTDYTGDESDEEARQKLENIVIAATNSKGERPRTVAMRLLVAAIEEAIAKGTVRPCNAVTAADVLWAGAHGLVSLGISPLMTPDYAREISQTLLATLIDGICQGKEEGRPSWSSFRGS